MKVKIISNIFSLVLVAALLLPLVGAFADNDTNGTTATGNDTEPDKDEEQVDITNFARGIELYCIDTETTLYSKGKDIVCAPSSSAKLMSALVAHEKIADLSEEIHITKEMTSGTAGLIYGFSSGMTTTYNDLITAMLVRNANDAALIISRNVAENTESFVELMNAKAAALGMYDTKYANPTGQGSAGTTTVADMMTLLSAFSEDEYLLSFSGLSSTKLASTKVTIHSRNFFLSRYYNGGLSYLNSSIIGGIADEKGETLLSVAILGGYTYLAVVMGGTEDEEGIFSYRITSKLLQWGHDNFDYITLIDKGKVICSLPVSMGYGADEVAVFPARTVTRYLARDTDLDSAVSFTYTIDKKSLTAPVSFGEKVGSLTLFLDGEQIEVIDLVVASDIPSSSSDYMRSEFVKFIKSSFFRGLVITVISVCIVYILVMAIVKGQRKKRLQILASEKEGER